MLCRVRVEMPLKKILRKGTVAEVPVVCEPQAFTCAASP